MFRTSSGEVKVMDRFQDGQDLRKQIFVHLARQSARSFSRWNLGTRMSFFSKATMRCGSLPCQGLPVVYRVPL